MALSLSEIEQQARNLTADERAKLADAMLETLQEPYADIEIAWQAEIADRAAAYARGDLATYPAEDVLAEAHRIASSNEEGAICTGRAERIPRRG